MVRPLFRRRDGHAGSPQPFSATHGQKRRVGPSVKTAWKKNHVKSDRSREGRGATYGHVRTRKGPPRRRTSSSGAAAAVAAVEKEQSSSSLRSFLLFVLFFFFSPLYSLLATEGAFIHARIPRMHCSCAKSNHRANLLPSLYRSWWTIGTALRRIINDDQKQMLTAFKPVTYISYYLLRSGVLGQNLRGHFWYRDEFRPGVAKETRKRVSRFEIVERFPRIFACLVAQLA